MITGIDSIPTSSNTATAPNAGSALGKEDFLQLLVAQLQAQDPLDPMDAQDFSAQLAQFSALEQMTNVNENLEKIQKFEAAMANTSAVGLIGKNVDAPGNTLNHQPGRSETLSYVLDGNASDVRVDVFNDKGVKVTSLGFSGQSAGVQRATWSGLDEVGSPVDAGNYSFRVAASDQAGNSINATTLAQGLVTELIFEGGQSFAIVNGERLPVDQISRISG
jgi:flagellar basal-body rod modification protein FlgD